MSVEQSSAACWKRTCFAEDCGIYWLQLLQYLSNELTYLLQHTTIPPDIPKAFVAWVGTVSVVNAHLVDDPTSRQPGFALPRQQWSLPGTVSAPDVTAVLVRRNGNFQTPISVPAVRHKRCHTLSNPAHRQDYTVACLNYTLQTIMPSPGWPVMAPNAYDNNNNYAINTFQLTLLPTDLLVSGPCSHLPGLSLHNNTVSKISQTWHTTRPTFSQAIWALQKSTKYGEKWRWSKAKI